MAVMVLDKGIIFYTDSELDEKIARPVREQLKKAELPIVSCSLAPLSFGKNVVEKGERGPVTMMRQIIRALEESTSTFVFFCEHDVLYHPSHFMLNPQENDVFYYNLNNWRWDYPRDRFIRYKGLTSLSQMCVNREYALNHYQKRYETLEKRGYNNDTDLWARKWGYEPGLKKKRNGAFSEEKAETWKSVLPNIDIRHKQTLSPRKVHEDRFTHAPTGWRETTANKLYGWKPSDLWNMI